MEEIKAQILKSLSSKPICVDEIFNTNIPSEDTFNALCELEREHKIKVTRDGLACVSLI
jgi:hypothetical protein